MSWMRNAWRARRRGVRRRRGRGRLGFWSRWWCGISMLFVGGAFCLLCFLGGFFLDHLENWTRTRTRTTESAVRTMEYGLKKLVLFWSLFHWMCGTWFSRLGHNNLHYSTAGVWDLLLYGLYTRMHSNGIYIHTLDNGVECVFAS